MRKIKKYFIIILLSIFTLTTVETSSLNFSAYIVQAKVSSSTKRKAQEAYRKFLTQRRYRYFTLWDIDKDGLKELLVTDGRERVGNSPIKAYAYTYTRGKLRYAGEIGSPMSGISYNCITKRLHASWGGCGNVEYWYYTLTKNKKVKQVICGAYVNGVKNGNVQYKCLYNKKKISLKKWKQITDKWIKQTSTLKYYRNTTSNRNILVYNIYKSQKKHVEKGSGFSAYSDYSVDELRSARFANSNMVMCMEKNIGKNHQCCCGQVYSNKNNKCPLCGKERRDK